MWNQGTSIDISSKTQENKGPAGKNFGVISSRYSQIYILNGKFNPNMDTITPFFPKSGHFFRLLKKSRGALPTSCVPAFYSLNHELVIRRQNEYRFTLPTLELINNHLPKRKQSTEVNDLYRVWQNILFGVPQGSVLRLLLFCFFVKICFLH